LAPCVAAPQQFRVFWNGFGEGETVKLVRNSGAYLH